MKRKPNNPFITSGYIGPEYFCNREKETSQILQAISSSRNITLISLRRIGKTGLLKHTGHLLEKKLKNIAFVYVDLLPTMNGSEMLNSLTSGLIRIKNEEKNFFQNALGILSRLRPKLSYDSITGQPSLELNIESASDIQYGFDQLLQFIAEIKTEIVVVLDEFQQINNYPEKNIEQLLRAVIQSYPTIPFIFSGSSKHMLEPMFMSANRAFYQSAELMYLNKIDEIEYREFVIELFKSGNIVIENNAVSTIFSWTRLHTFYVQYVCNLLYETGQNKIEENLVNDIFYKVLSSYDPLFASYRNLLPSQQFKLMQAIAIEGSVSQPMASGFIQKHKLTSASSVTTSLKALAEKEMIVKEDENWMVYDVFFSRWLEYHYRK